MSVWAPFLSVFGLHLSTNETVHRVFLVISVASALCLGAVRARRSGFWFPLLATSVGCALLVTGELVQERWTITLAGTVVLFTALVVERRHATSRATRAVGT